MKFTATNILSGTNNTLKEGLVAATIAIAVAILSVSSPRSDGGSARRRHAKGSRWRMRMTGKHRGPVQGTAAAAARRGLTYYAPRSDRWWAGVDRRQHRVP